MPTNVYRSRDLALPWRIPPLVVGDFPLSVAESDALLGSGLRAIFPSITSSASRLDGLQDGGHSTD